MSLDEVYSLAHIAQCRLDIEARRRNRSLRYVVGHMMHCESLRLQINEIEEDASYQSERTRRSDGGIRFSREQEDDVINQSQPSSSSSHDDEHEDDDYLAEDDMYYDDEADSDDLCLSRCPSTISRPTQSIPLAPELESDDSSDSDEDDSSPPPSPEMVRAVVTCGSTDTISLMYEAAQAAACLGSPVSTPFTNPWELSPQSVKGSTSHRLSLGEVVC